MSELQVLKTQFAFHSSKSSLYIVIGLKVNHNVCLYIPILAIAALKRLSDASLDETVRNQSKGALWILEGKDKKAPEKTVTTHLRNNSQPGIRVNH